MTDTFRLIQLHDIPAAFSLLTRLAVPVDHARAGARGAQAGWAWPLVGAVIGLISGLVAWLALLLGLPGIVAAFLALTISALLTGGLHEDGLADCADGLGGGRDKAHALDIMKDSRVGAYGLIALILAFGLRGNTIGSLEAAIVIPALAMAGASSRAVMLAAMYGLPPAREGGLSAHTGQPLRGTVMVGLALGLIPLALFAPLALIPALLLPLPLAVLAMRKIGGQTGDVLGAVQHLSEIGCLLGLVIALS